jgi:hypothetical protein
MSIYHVKPILVHIMLKKCQNLGTKNKRQKFVGWKQIILFYMDEN